MRRAEIQRRCGPVFAARIGATIAMYAVAAGFAAGRPAAAAEPCVFAPGMDGVLRLDGDHGAAEGRAWPCTARSLRAYNALPETFDVRPARPKAGPVRAKADIRSAPVPDAARSGDDDVARLKDETTRLKDEMARLRDEASRLRAETVRLKSQLALREAPPAGNTDISKTEGGRSDVGKSDSGKTERKIDGKVGSPAAPGPVAALPAPASVPKSDLPKGDLLTTEPHTSEIAKTPADKTSAGTIASDRKAPIPDERAFERQKGVVERAWKQLIDLAARMKGDVSGKPE